MDILTIDYHSQDAAERFCRSCHETGFALLQNVIDWQSVTAVREAWQAFFQDPQRYDYPYDPQEDAGYCPDSEVAKGATVKDLKEFYNFRYKGSCPDALRQPTQDLVKQLFAVAEQLLTWLNAALPPEIQDRLQCPLPQMVALEEAIYRIIHYPALPEAAPAGAMRAASHEDINMMTILPAATMPGLQAKDLNGQWHSIQVDPQTIVVNIGDMMQEATGGYYPSTTHRVINPQENDKHKPRFSTPLFIEVLPDIYLSERYPTARSYLQERLRENALL